MLLKLPSLVLAAASLAGGAAAQDGCFPSYRSGGSYAEGDWVSAVVSVAESAPALRGKTTPAPKTFNFRCSSKFFCPNVGYAPDGHYGSLAWEQADEPCSGTADPPSAPAPPAWSGGGEHCPLEFSTSAEYGGGDVVSVCRSDQDWCTVYKCKPDLPAPGKFCDKRGYEPGQSLYWDVAWEDMGSCSGPFQDVSSVAHEILQDLGKCPGKYATGPEKYSAGDRVSKDGKVFQCKEWPYAQWCSQAGYEPLVSAATPNAWKYAWDLVGRCSGTIDTISDAVEAGVLPRTSLGVCDASEYRLGTKYGPGELATVCTHEHFCIVYRCAMDMPHPSRWCGQEGYTPGSGSAWTMAWTEEGYCTTTATPTASPTSSPSNAPSISSAPSGQPSMNPSVSNWPTSQPSEMPSESLEPTHYPTSSPTRSPTKNPTKSPTQNPTASPTKNPTQSPTTSPTESPTKNPTASPTANPTKSPTQSPTKSPTNNPTASPTKNPTESPTESQGSTILDFGGLNLPNGAPIPNGQYGLNWIDWGYLVQGAAVTGGCRDAEGEEGANTPCTLSSPGTITSADPTDPLFSVHGFWATAAEMNGLMMTVRSYDINNNQMGEYRTTSPHLTTGGPTYIDLSSGGFDNIRRLVIQTSIDGNPNWSSIAVVIDDMHISL